MAMDLTALKSEITLDPAGLGYGSQTDDQVAKLLNRVRAQDAGNANFEVNRREVSGADIASAMVPSEFTALSAANRDYVAMLTNGETLTANRFRDNILALFPNATAPLTRAGLQDVFKKQVSRSQKLFDEDTTPSQVADARRLP
jgi:hypothetical protein